MTSNLAYVSTEGEEVKDEEEDDDERVRDNSLVNYYI